VSVRVEPRFTRDIDLAVAVADDRAAEQLVADTPRGMRRDAGTGCTIDPDGAAVCAPWGERAS
jgi:hypothetical protein